MSIRSLLLVAVAASGTACQALALPTSQPTPPPTHTMSAVVQVPVGADKAHVDAAQAVLAKRLKSLGITNFTVAVGPVMQFSLIVPDSVDPKAVEAVLHARGVVGWLPWPSDKPAPVAGDRASPGATPLFDATQVVSVEPSTESSGQPGIDIRLDPEATRALAIYSSKHVGEPLPIILDGVVVTAPTVQSPIRDGHLLLTGPEGDADGIPFAALAAILASGPLPAAWRP
ncbi:MAG: hypothetical protein E6J39_02155 [Chloroflexi bacterium]|nr:MAG: hypothetical protein E6J39_02155 [Chloroflexota bacterium]